MTNREFFERVIETVEDAEVVEFAKASIAKLDERNAKRKEQTSKKAKENEPIKYVRHPLVYLVEAADDAFLKPSDIQDLIIVVNFVSELQTKATLPDKQFIAEFQKKIISYLLFGIYLIHFDL